MSGYSWKNYIQKQHDYYKLLEPVYNPYINQYIHFNGTGFKHIVYKSGRSSSDIRQRLALLPHAVSALQAEPISTWSEGISLYYVFTYEEMEAGLIIKAVARKTGDRGNLNFLTVYRVK